MWLLVVRVAATNRHITHSHRVIPTEGNNTLYVSTYVSRHKLARRRWKTEDGGRRGREGRREGERGWEGREGQRERKGGWEGGVD